MLKTIFADALGISPDAVHDELRYNTIQEWDSVAHLALVAAIEQAYDILLEADDVIDLSSVGEARRILKKYGHTV